MSYIEFKNINKVYPNGFHAVKDFNLTINEKEFIVFVGPSGCGKTTTLRMFAGLEDISKGDLLINDSIVNEVESKDRNIAMVFQNYALYPHMTIFDNMSYGLKFRKVPKPEIETRVKEAMNILGFEESYLKRKPAQLSGGQKQRVALGRAIVRRPGVFLMDEPLSNLDAKLRVQMRNEITRIHRTVGATTIYVTHDQIEAMTMADRIVVMNDGYIQQIDTPQNIYDFPVNVFVASFIGSPAMNFFNAKLENGFIVLDNTKIKLPEKRKKMYSDYEGKEVILGIRPEDCYYYNPSVTEFYPDAQFTGIVDNIEQLGFESLLYVSNNYGKLITKVIYHKVKEKIGEQVSIQFDLNRFHLFDKDTKMRIK